MAENLVTRAVGKSGGPKIVASECGVSYQAVLKWMKNGLPRTEWTGETDYSSVIERLSKSEFSRRRLLDARKPKRNGKPQEARA